jgi:hypothetical protein
MERLSTRRRRRRNRVRLAGRGSSRLAKSRSGSSGRI